MTEETQGLIALVVAVAIGLVMWLLRDSASPRGPQSDPYQDARLARDETTRAERERKAMLEGYGKASEENTRLMGILSCIRKAAVRNERERRWELRDMDVAMHDVAGRAAGFLMGGSDAEGKQSRG